MMPNGSAPNRTAEVIVFVEKNAPIDAVESLQERFEVRPMQEMPDVAHSGLVMRLDADGLWLVGSGQEYRGDFAHLLPRIRSGNLHRELVVRASAVKNTHGTPTAVDATAGMGEDALLLAAAGFKMLLYERDPVIAALLGDTLRRAALNPDLACIAQSMQLLEADSIAALPQLSPAPDVVLLDPMFPARQKSALIKKKFQLLQQLESPCPDEEALLDAAIAAHPHKVVIKRPLKGPYLAEHKPDYSLRGKSIRYDCIVIAR